MLTRVLYSVALLVTLVRRESSDRPREVLWPPDYPFAVGETLRYSARLGFVPVGGAVATVSGISKVRGSETFVLRMEGSGGPRGLQVSYEMMSWVGTQRFTSRRFYRSITRNGTTQGERFEIIPDSSRYRQEGVEGEWVAPSDPLDELALLYFLRTTPLEVGRWYRVSRYFKVNYNPITVRVPSREVVTLPNGQRASCLLVEITVLGSTSEVLLTDDRRRLPVELRLPLPYGTVTLALEEMPAGRGGQSGRSAR